jgi:hypothetical protein
VFEGGFVEDEDVGEGCDDEVEERAEEPGDCQRRFARGENLGEPTT